MTRDVERRLLQAAVALICLVPLAAGTDGIVRSAAMVNGVAPPIAIDLDSHFRYLSGLLFGIGLAFLAMIPRIETRGAAFRMLGSIVVVGGVGRLIALATHGQPGPTHLVALAIELGVVPLLVLWQTRVAGTYPG